MVKRQMSQAGTVNLEIIFLLTSHLNPYIYKNLFILDVITDYKMLSPQRHSCRDTATFIYTSLNDNKNHTEKNKPGDYSVSVFAF